MFIRRKGACLLAGRSCLFRKSEPEGSEHRQAGVHGLHRVRTAEDMYRYDIRQRLTALAMAGIMVFSTAHSSFHAEEIPVESEPAAEISAGESAGEILQEQEQQEPVPDTQGDTASVPLEEAVEPPPAPEPDTGVVSMPDAGNAEELQEEAEIPADTAVSAEVPVPEEITQPRAVDVLTWAGSGDGCISYAEIKEGTLLEGYSLTVSELEGKKAEDVIKAVEISDEKKGFFTVTSFIIDMDSSSEEEIPEEERYVQIYLPGVEFKDTYDVFVLTDNGTWKDLEDETDRDGQVTRISFRADLPSDDDDVFVVFDTEEPETHDAGEEEETAAPGGESEESRTEPATETVTESGQETEALSETETEITETEEETDSETAAEETEEAPSPVCFDFGLNTSEKVYEYEDDSVKITAEIKEPGVIPEDAVFVCEKTDEKSERYEQLLRRTAEFLGLSEDRIDILPYDIRFMVGDTEVEPSYGSVNVSFTLKEPIRIEKGEEAPVIHIRNDSDIETLDPDVSHRGTVEEYEVKLDGFSPVILATPAGSSPLKSIMKTDDEGNEYHISKTPNINESGVGTSYYANSQNLTDTVSCDGALYLDVEVRYGGEWVRWDYLYIKDSAGTTLLSDADGNTVGCTNSSYIGRIGGSVNFENSSTGQYKNPANTLHYRFEEDTLQFVWHTDGSGQGYGYYAIVRPVYPEGDVPDYHFEELEDGTYALVFDKGGDINAFVNRPDVKAAIAPYKNKISEVRLHKGTTSVDNGAFKGLSSLKKVTIPRNPALTKIGKNAFAGCDNLETLNIPATVTEMNGTALTGCTALETVTFAQGNTMTSLPNGLFRGLTALKNVNIPSGVTQIPDSLFEGCTSLTAPVLPDGITSIGASAFKGTAITELPGISTVTSIGARAFSGCKGLTEVSIPANVTSIGTSAFENCTNVTDFVFEEGTSFPTLPTYLFSGMSKLKNVTLPGDLTRIPNYCFTNCTSLEHVDIPDSVTRMGDYAFNGCRSLKDFEIPSQVTALGPYLFSGCTSLKDMSIPATVTDVGAGLFYNCSGLIRAGFEDGSPVSTLPNSMFYGCSKLESVKLPDTVTAIPSSYFRGCISLKNVSLPENLTSIGDYAFYDCYNLQEIPLTNKLKTIGSYAFYNCDGITDVVIPKSVTSIGTYAWQNCDGIRSVEWEAGSPMTTLNAYMFYNCKNLETCVLPERLSYVPNFMFYDCAKLHDVELPATVASIRERAFYGCTSLTEIDIPDACTQIYSYAFNGSGLTEVDLPARLGSIGDYAFYGTKLREVTIPNQVTSVGASSFSSIPTLETVTFQDGGKNCTIGESAFSSDPALRNLHLKDEITTIGRYAFRNDSGLNEITIPGKTTTIGSYAFQGETGASRLVFEPSPTNTALSIDSNGNGYTFARLSNVDEVVIDRDVTSNNKTKTNFNGLNPNASITIGSHVNTLDNMFVSVFRETTKITFEGENDFSVSTRIANMSEDEKWSNLKGDFYVDPDGVVYKLNKADKTASLFHIPAGITDYTVPATVTSVAGVTYNVTSAEPYSVRDADDLVTLVFENPEETTLPQYSLTGCPTLATVNGEPELFREDWAQVSYLCGFPVHMDEEPEQVLSILNSTDIGEPAPGEEQPRFSFGVSLTNQESMADDGLTYVFPTGKSARLDFAISNESNVDMSDRVVRIFFAFDGENYTFGNYPPGTYTLVNTATNSRYPLTVGETDTKGVFYYDITGFKPGDTLAFNNQFQYPSPSSGGGTMKIWAESLSAAHAAETAGHVSQPGKYIEAMWYTEPVPYNLKKTVNGNPQFEFVSNQSSESDDNIYVRNMSWKIDLTSSGAGGTAYAKDYIKYVEFEDELVLTENMIWNPDIVEAVRNGEYYVSSGNYMYAKVNGRWEEVCHLSFTNTSYIRSIGAKVVTDANGNDAVCIKWAYTNQYWADETKSPTADLPATTYTVTVGNHAVQVRRDSDLWDLLREGGEYTEEESEAMRRVTNAVKETSHYSYSEDQVNNAQAPERLVYTTTGFNMSKTSTGYTTFGREHGFVISLENTGLMHKTDIDVVEDSLRNHYYIEASDMESMFRDPKWGPYARIDITSATLCAKPDKTAVDVYGNTIEGQTAQQSGIDPIPYSGCAPAGSDASETETAAKMSFYWDEEREHIVFELKNDAGQVQSTYLIGNGGDYASIQEALDDIGYVVTYRASYGVRWDLGDSYTLHKAKLDGVEVSDVSELTAEQLRKYEYRLRSGRTDKFTIPSRTKKTTMWLTADNPNYYPNSSVSSSNTAYARDDTGRQVGVANWTGTLYRELTLGKSASANGSTWSSSIKIPDNTVIDYTLSFTNSGETYDVLPLTDKMGGSQILLVPVRGNRNALYYALGSDTGVPLQDAGMEEYVYGGIPYYVMDRSGTYRGITIDGRLTDSISVTTGQGAATTLITWYYQDVTGASANAGSVTRSVTYRALADSARLGGVTEDDAGSTVTRHSLANETWLGGHQTHRLYASLGGEVEQMQFIKWIVEDPEAEREDLIRHSLVQDGDEVVYKMIIRNTGKHEATLRGSRIHDELPSTSGIFPWSKDNVLDITYVTENLGSSVETTGPDYWYINSTEPGTGADTASRGLYYIRWTNDFSIHFDPESEVWIYVRLKFPSSSDVDGEGHPTNTWDDYIARNNGGVITNYFYVGQKESHVTHELVDVVEGKLQKGVLDTGLSTSGKFQSEGTRLYYQNGGNTDNGSVQEVAYYTVLYNSGNVRLYLDPLRDQLPKGFKFRSVINGISKNARTNAGYSVPSSGSSTNVVGSYASISTINYTENLTGNSSYFPVAAVSDPKRSVTYKNVRVSASTETDEDGHQQVTFTLGRQTNSDSYLRYDSDLKKYYLNPGEAIRFGYICTVEGYKRTENIANNEIAMPVYDKYGLGARMSDDDVRILPAAYMDLAPNDGSCDQVATDIEVTGRRHPRSDWVKGTTEWWTSDVSLERLSSVPGVLKTVGGETPVPGTAQISPTEIYGTKYNSGNPGGTPYSGTVARTSIVNWLIRAYNEGGTGANSMEDFWIIDTVDAPYRFTGNFFYDYYNVNGTRMTSSSVPVFSLGGRTEGDTSVKISTVSGSTLTLNSTLVINGPPVSVDSGKAEVQLLRDENGVETLKIHFIDASHRIPPNSYMALYAHTQYVSTDAVISKQFYNHVQLEPTTEFDPVLVSQGRVLYRDDNGEYIPYAIESGASVTMTAGYSSAARKQVTEMGVTSNTGWSDREKNYIMLPEKHTKFYYDLYVDLPKDDPTQKFVMIDTLPEPGDHSPFVDRDRRDSQFIVHILSENPGFSVWSSPNLGAGTKVQLPYGTWSLEVNTKTEFEPEDWNGQGGGWSAVTLEDGISPAEEELLESARSFRIIIEDEDLLENPLDATMGKNFQVQVRFNAELLTPEDADPGTIAWNSFGYRYTVPIGNTGISTSLNAEPLKVGVLIPAVPYIIKDQKTPHSHYRAIDTDSEYRFLVYSGQAIAALNDTSEMTPAQIAQILADNGRIMTVTDLTIAGGTPTGRTDYLDDEKVWEYDPGEDRFVPTDANWGWTNNGKYTVIELPWEENGFVFSNTQHSPVNNYTFTQNSSNDVAIRVTNEYAEKGNLRISKTVTGPNADRNKRFTFTIHLQDGRYPVYGTFEYTGTNIADGTITFDDAGNASILLRHGQAIEITGIPDGYTYTVTESTDPLYSQTSEGTEGTILKNETGEASFLNTRKDAAISISKEVRGNFGNRFKLFDFEVYVTDEGKELEGVYQARITHDDETSEDITVTFSEGAAVIRLRHGDVAQLLHMPVGVRYEVDELPASRAGYTVSSTGETGTLGEQGASSAWVNTRRMVVPTSADTQAAIFFIIFALAALAFTGILLRRRRTNTVK